MSNFKFPIQDIFRGNQHHNFGYFPEGPGESLWDPMDFPSSSKKLLQSPLNIRAQSHQTVQHFLNISREEKKFPV